MHYKNKAQTLLGSKTGYVNKRPALVGRQKCVCLPQTSTAFEAGKLLPQISKRRWMKMQGKSQA